MGAGAGADGREISELAHGGMHAHVDGASARERLKTTRTVAMRDQKERVMRRPLGLAETAWLQNSAKTERERERVVSATYAGLYSRLYSGLYSGLPVGVDFMVCRW